MLKKLIAPVQMLLLKNQWLKDMNQLLRQVFGIGKDSDSKEKDV